MNTPGRRPTPPRGMVGPPRPFSAWPEHGPNLGERLRLIAWASQRNPRSQASSGHFPPTPSSPLSSLGDSGSRVQISAPRSVGKPCLGGVFSSIAARLQLPLRWPYRAQTPRAPSWRGRLSRAKGGRRCGRSSPRTSAHHARKLEQADTGRDRPSGERVAEGIGGRCSSPADLTAGLRITLALLIALTDPRSPSPSSLDSDDVEPHADGAR